MSPYEGGMKTMPPADPDRRPTPDPTVLTTEAVERGLRAERDYVDGQFGILAERLRGIDKATEVVAEGLSNGPIKSSVQHLRELSDEKFLSIQTQFKERDTRAERESRDNKLAVDAAFAAQEKQAAAQNKFSAEGIGKSEVQTGESIKKLAELSDRSIAALSDKVDDLKERVTKAEGRSQGLGAGWGYLVGAAGLVAAVLTIVIVFAGR